MADDGFSQCAQRDNDEIVDDDDDEDNTPSFPQPQKQPLVFVEETDLEDMGKVKKQQQQQQLPAAKRRRTTTHSSDLSSRYIDPDQFIDNRDAIRIMWNKVLHEELGLTGSGWTHLPLLPAPKFTHPFDTLAEDLTPGPLKDKIQLLSTALQIIGDEERYAEDQKKSDEWNEKKRQEEEKDRQEEEERKQKEKENKETQEE